MNGTGQKTETNSEPNLCQHVCQTGSVYQVQPVPAVSVSGGHRHSTRVGAPDTPCLRQTGQDRTVQEQRPGLRDTAAALTAAGSAVFVNDSRRCSLL